MKHMEKFKQMQNKKRTPSMSKTSNNVVHKAALGFTRRISVLSTDSYDKSVGEKNVEDELYEFGEDEVVQRNGDD